MVIFLDKTAFKSILYGIILQQRIIHKKPVKRGPASAFIMHLVVYHPMVLVIEVEAEIPILIIKHIADIGRVGNNAPAGF